MFHSIAAWDVFANRVCFHSDRMQAIVIFDSLFHIARIHSHIGIRCNENNQNNDHNESKPFYVKCNSISTEQKYIPFECLNKYRKYEILSSSRRAYEC